MTLKFTPMNLIGSIMTLAAFATLVVGANNYWITKAEADEVIGKVVRQQQVDRTEVDKNLIDLEIRYLEDKIEADGTEADAQDKSRLEYLKQRRTILEEYALKLQSED